MPDNIVILFMFSVLASFGIVWFANVLRTRYQARYLEYNFYFILSSICYGFANWIVPFAVLYLLGARAGTDPAWFVAIFILISVPVLLVKLYFFVLLFQELLGRVKPAWFNKLSIVTGTVVLLVSAWYVQRYYTSSDVAQLQGFIISFGLAVVGFEFAIIIQYLVAIKRETTRVIDRYSMPFGLVLLGGYLAYVLLTYSGLFLPGSSLVELTPYVYFIIHGLPLVVLWLFHQNEPRVVLYSQAPGILKFIEANGLTAKEAEILKQVISGASNREIAERSFISPHTVRNHIYNIYNKTGIRNRFQLLAVCQADDPTLVD
ncbi:MAG: helix-turn-helix transcriptional regulator [Motiliproteus sp.]|nr:helix-turn-helix transcriptional regulator [Motiliproteus sp.]